MKYALCLQTYPAFKTKAPQFTKGKLYQVREIDKYHITIVADDTGEPNGWNREFFILFDSLDNVEVAKLLYLKD